MWIGLVDEDGLVENDSKDKDDALGVGEYSGHNHRYIFSITVAVS